MKETLFVAAIVFLILIVAYTAVKPKGLEMKSKDDSAVSQQTAKAIEIEDYYYSAQITQHWHEINRAYGSKKLMVNKVNGIAYTERVTHGANPTYKVTDAVLVASGVEGEGLTVEYTNVAW